MSASTATIDTLQGSIQGGVIAPTDDEYDEAREVFYGGIDKRPSAIARVANDDDIRRVIEIARRSDVELAIRGGGHSLSGKCSSDGGIVLDLRALNALDIDADGRTAEAGAGLTAAQYTSAVGAKGLATGFGDTGSVGISGITLGGGVGFLRALYERGTTATAQAETTALRAVEVISLGARLEGPSLVLKTKSEVRFLWHARRSA